MSVQRDPQTELAIARHYETLAGEYEQFCREVDSTIHAINSSGLLDAAPADPAGYRNHCAGSVLLDMIRDRCARIMKMAEDGPGTDLSIHLSVVASSLEKASGLKIAA